MTNNPIVIVEDDKDDCEILLTIFKEIGVENDFRCFENAVEAIKYLRTTTEDPFIIISDINIPLMNGIEFKKVIDLDETISKKRIPFVFLSTSKENYLLDECFHLSVQGYFKKPSDLNSLREIAKAIIVYWKHGTIKHNPHFINL